MQKTRKKTKNRLRAVVITVATLLVILLGAGLAAAGLLLSPAAESGIPVPTGGVGVESLTGGGVAWLSGGLRAKLLAAAMSRGSVTADGRFTLALAALSFEGEGQTAEQLLLTDPKTGELAARGADGEIRQLQSGYVARLLDCEQLYSASLPGDPPPIICEGERLSALSAELSCLDLKGEQVETRFEGGYREGITVTKRRPVVFAELPQEGSFTVSRHDGEQVFAGPLSDILSFVPDSDGFFDYNITTSLVNGSASYRAVIEYHFEPEFSLSAESVVQGDSLVLTVANAGDTRPSCSYPIDYEPVFLKSGELWWCYLPFNHVVEPGIYEVAALCGDYAKTFEVEVTEADFEVQNLTISTETANSTVNSDEANAEYVETIYPLFEVADQEIYWSGSFVQPVSGSITTQYGVYRYTNGSSTASRHKGIDIATDEGTPIVAPNAGRVLYAGFLKLSGNTIMIEHGGGLHTLYMHMQDLAVSTGDMVEQGRTIGYVGTTGYSTGPHLHFEIQMGDRSISPWSAFDGTAGFYSAPTQSDD